MSQLEIDLRNRIREKLKIWMSDSLDLYEMADLPDDVALAAAVDVLMRATAGALAFANTDPHKIAEVFYQLLLQQRRRKTEFDKKHMWDD